MKVIQNNYKNQPRNRHQIPEEIKPKLRVEKVKIKCENCGSVLEVSREDTHIGYLGLPHVTCPCCNYEMDVEEFDDDAIDIYASNVKYPTHFTVSSKDFRAIEISDEEINKKMLKKHGHPNYVHKFETVKGWRLHSYTNGEFEFVKDGDKLLKMLKLQDL